MPRRVRPVSHEDQLSLVEHLDELRHRLVVCLVIFAVALALCFWQNHLLLEIAQSPLPSGHKKLITFGVTEPFTTTLTVSAYGAAILAAPFILWQLYAYILPAFSPKEKQVALPILLLFPVLFVGGILRRPALPARLQRQPVQHPGAGAGLLQLLLDDDARGGARLPDADGDPGGDAPRDREDRAAHQEPPLRLSGHRDHRRGAAWGRPGLDVDRDGSPIGSL
jgi:hypothetical protein